jgi:hypothetical protein
MHRVDKVRSYRVSNKVVHIIPTVNGTAKADGMSRRRFL